MSLLELLATPAHAALINPTGTTDLRVVIGHLIQGALGLSGVVALLMFIIGGVQYLTASGDPEKAKKAKRTLIWTTLGLVVLFSSYAIVYALIRAITGGDINPT